MALILKRVFFNVECVNFQCNVECVFPKLKICAAVRRGCLFIKECVVYWSIHHVYPQAHFHFVNWYINVDYIREFKCYTFFLLRSLQYFKWCLFILVIFMDYRLLLLNSWWIEEMLDQIFMINSSVCVAITCWELANGSHFNNSFLHGILSTSNYYNEKRIWLQ